MNYQYALSLTCAGIGYVLTVGLATAQTPDSTSEISNQVDANVTEQISTISTQSDVEEQPSVPPENAKVEPTGKLESLSQQLKDERLKMAEDDIKDLSSRGFSKEDIRKHLHYVGYCNEIIKDAFHDVFGHSPSVRSGGTEKAQFQSGIVPFQAGGGGTTTADKGEFPYSGYGNRATSWKTNKVIMLESFVEKNSFLGKGTTDSYQTQEGWSFNSPVGTSIQPYLSYQNSSTELLGANTYHANTYGAALNLTQRVVPLTAVFQDNQPNATLNLGSTKSDPWCEKDPTIKPDHYPNLDVQAGLNLSYGDSNLATLTHGWAYNTDDSYGISPNAAVDFYLKPSSNLSDAPSLEDLMPCAISIVPTYGYLMTEDQHGDSASSGLLSIQDRNTYSFVIGAGPDCDRTPWQSIQVTEINTLFHDTNQEFLTPQTGPIRYQNWARFGLAISYMNLGEPPTPDLCNRSTARTNSLPLAKIEYDYDAFNNQYEEHTVLLTVNFSF